MGPRWHTSLVEGLVENLFRFEFIEAVVWIDKMLSLAQPNPEVTNVHVMRNLSAVRNVNYCSLDQVRGVRVYDGDEVLLAQTKNRGPSRYAWRANTRVNRNL